MLTKRLHVIRDAAAVLVTVCLLAGAAIEGSALGPPAAAAPYHARCRAAAQQIPLNVGDWTGRDIAVPAQAVQLLRPNVVMSRRYTNTITGHAASVLLVQCRDVRDIVSHYPPICYPVTRGMELAASHQRELNVGQKPIPLTEYEFRSSQFGPGQSVVVQNFILMPSGDIATDMEPVKRQLALRNRYLGAGQVQVVFGASVPADARDRAFVELVGAFRPLIDAVLSGRGQEQ
jgi:Protein of unknown function (DUF3485)